MGWRDKQGNTSPYPTPDYDVSAADDPAAKSRAAKLLSERSQEELNAQARGESAPGRK